MTLKEATIQRIFNLCDERGLNINKLSIVCGMTQSTVNNIVNGRNKSTTTSTIKKICDGWGKTTRPGGGFFAHFYEKSSLAFAAIRVP